MDAVDYKNGQKNHWRRMVWNETLRRVRSRSRTELILYLPGSKDLDRVVAMSKGVPGANLVAIDNNTLIVRELRDRGIPTIQGELLDVLASWPRGHKVCAVMADFCSGLELNSNLALLDQFQHPDLINAVLCINLMRGRDPSTNKWLKMDRSAGSVILPTAEALAGNDKHRAAQFVAYHALDMILAAMNPPGHKEAMENGGGFVQIPAMPTDLLAKFARQLFRPCFYSYLSTSGQVFDSAVLNPFIVALDSLVKLQVKGIDPFERIFKEVWSDTKADSDTRQRVIASLAVRTRRMRAGNLQ